MSLSPLESKLINAVNVAVDTGAHLVAQNNPAYDSLITLLVSVGDQINAAVNPSAPGTADAIAAAAQTLASSVAPVTGAATTIASKTASATQKASAAGIIIGDVEAVFASIKSFF